MSLFVDDDVDGDINPSIQHDELENREPNHIESEIAQTGESEVSSAPALDYVELASIMKNFHARDPLFINLPEYMIAIIKDLLEYDSLVVLGRGLGLAQIVQTFLRKIKQCAPNALVLVLGNENEDERSDALDDCVEKTMETIGFSVTASKRTKMYARGGTYRITAPITVLDILSKTLDPTSVSGIIVMHAERISENSPAAFALRLLKQHNKYLFVKCFSSSPERIVMPPSLPVRLRILQVPTVMLWPRFHLLVDRSLPKLEVEEIIVEQPESVRRQQALLSELFQQVLSDIKRRVPHLDVDYLAPALGTQQQLHANPEKSHETTTVDQILAIPDLAFKIRGALQSVWHKLSRDGKRSVNALGTLAQLQHSLTQNDAQQFREELEFSCKDSDQPWVDLPATDLLVSEARTAAVLSRVPAKFTYLLEILRGIPDRQRVVIACNSAKTVLELMEFVRNGPTSEQDEERLARVEQEMRMRDEEEARKREQKRADQINAGRPGRRRVRGGSAKATWGELHEKISDKRDRSEEHGSDETAEKTKRQKNDSPKHAVVDADADVDVSASAAFAVTSVNSVSRHFNELNRLDITLTTFNSQALTAVNPQHVILYEPNLPFTRELERFSGLQQQQRSGMTLQVYFMYYQRSVEELQYLATMRKEKDAFTKLIREKGLMPMTFHDDDEVNDAGAGAGGMRVVESGGSGPARRTYVTTQPHRIVVDAREFRSALPFFIWQQRMEVLPLTLLVGDYVLTPDLVVERKSIADLVGSFRNGRLYEQCESMLNHYKTAVLLIEFDGPTHFSMEPFREIRSRASADVQREIQDNLCALLLRFPKLKLIWASSPLHTAQIFRGLKEAEPEPEPQECAMAGKSVLYDSLALSMLESLPGITSGNAHLIAQIASTMTEVTQLSEPQLVKTLGIENGKKLFRFLNS